MKSQYENSLNNEEKLENNFYDACIQAIQSNNDEILNKLECINQINKLKFHTINKRNKSTNETNKKQVKAKKSKIPITQKSIDEILEESKRKFEKLNKIKENTNENINNNKILGNIKNNNDNNCFYSGKNNNLNKYFGGKQRRYSVFKHIKEYLESNDVTLNELIDDNPFQEKPYLFPGSYEFIEAVKFGNLNYVKEALLNDGIFLFVIDYFGQTGYHWAAKLGNINMLDILIKFGRHHNQKDFKGRTPLYLAAVNNNMEICKYLLTNGANPFLSDKNGKTPADVAKSTKVIDLLRKNMAQPFSNPAYKAKMQQILLKRAEHFFKIKKEKNKNEFRAGRRYSTIKKKNKINEINENLKENNK